MMELISQKLSAGRAPMSVVNTKKTTFGPILVLSVRWSGYVQNNWDSIFVVISKKALVSYCGVCSYNSIPFIWAFSFFIVWNNDSGPRQEIFFNLLRIFKNLWIMDHFSYINCCKLIDCLDNSIFCIMALLLFAIFWILFEKRIHVNILLPNWLKWIEFIIDWI